MSRAVLSALCLASGKADWRADVCGIAERRGWRVERFGQYVDVWRPQCRRRLEHGGWFNDGWQLRRLWLGPGRYAIGVAPRRIYLLLDGGVDRRPERCIVQNRPRSPLPDRLQSLTECLRQLGEGGGVFGRLVGLAVGENELLDGVTLRGSRDTFPAGTSFRTVHEKGGFIDVPDHLEICLCRDEAVDASDMEDYVARCKAECLKRGVEAAIMHVALDQLEARIWELDHGATATRRNVPVLFMLRGGVATTPSSRLSQVMRRMDRHGLPWRRAWATDDRAWSVADQLGSLLQAAGGLPHSVIMAGGENLPWSIGVDVSHRAEFSRAAATLVGPDGRLEGAWTLDQPRQENIRPGVLRRLLGAAGGAIPPNERASGMLVIRDGRVFESESVDDYRRDFGGPVTLVELRKNGNPPILMGDSWQLPTQPMVGWLPEARGGSLGFLVALPQTARNEFDSVIKVWMRNEWDGLGLGQERLARILTAQTLTPGLGLHPRRLPAPVYWADGIAGASDDDLRFRGQVAVALDGCG